MGRKKDTNIFKITQFQDNNCVTSSSIMVEVGGKKLLFDLGMIQDSRLTFPQTYHSVTQKIQSIPFNELDYVVITHCHHDHFSLVPILARCDINFHGEIITTELTAKLGRLIALDACKINEGEVAKYRDGKDKGNFQKYYPYYSKYDVEEVIGIIKCYGYNQRIKLSDNLYITLKPACHIAGASMIYLEYETEYKTHALLYTGDITYNHNIDRPFTKRIIDEKLKVDTLIMESTYGVKNKSSTYSTYNPEKFLETIIIQEVLNNKQTLWIPSFAVGRSTSIAYYLNNIYKRNPQLKQIPVYFCGGMMYDAHNTIGQECNNEYYDTIWHDEKEVFKKEPFSFLTNKKDVEYYCLNNARKLIISSSGMVNQGYSGLLAKSYVSNKRVSFLCCGYQSEGTLGRQIQNGEKFVNVNGEGRNVRLRYCGTIPSLSGHATHDGLIDFAKSLNQTRLKNIILVHGDDNAKQELKEDLEKELGKNKHIHIIKQFETLKF